LEFIKELKSFAPLLLCIVVACLCIWFLFVVIGSKKFWIFELQIWYFRTHNNPWWTKVIYNKIWWVECCW